MALNIIYGIYIQTAPDPSGFPSYSATRSLKIYWDDSASNIRVDLLNTDSTYNSTPVSGPNMSAPNYVQRSDFNYQFCSGTTLIYFTLDLNTFPYAIRQQAPNSNLCTSVGSACDVLVSTVTTTPASGILTPDGTATLRAQTSRNPLKYKLGVTTFDYYSDGTVIPGSGASLVFSNLIPGNYIICFIDTALCRKTSSFTIGNNPLPYLERWKSDFRDLKTNAVHRLSIEDKLLPFGPTVDIKMDIASVQTSWRGEAVEDSFNPVIPSQLTAVLFSETDQQFVDLYTGDETRFKIKKYINTGAGFILQWVGYAPPMLYREPYTEAYNYPVNLVAMDMLGNLVKIPFSNDQRQPFTSRISYMEAISTILRFTNLQLNIRESVNLFESTMTQTAADSMLVQCTIDPDSYKNADGSFMDCLTILKSLLTNLGCRLYMDNGQWNIDMVENLSSTNIAYRVFNYLGVYQSNGTYNPTISIGTSLINNRIVPLNNSVYMNIVQNYGTFNFVNNLHIVNNFLRGGDMEQIENVGGNPTFKGWSVDTTNGPGVTFKLEQLDKPNRASNFAASFDFKNAGAGAMVVLKSDPFTYAYPTAVGGFRGKLIFDVYTRPQYTDTYIFLDYEVKMGTGFLQNEGYGGTGSTGARDIYISTNLLLSGEYNRVYITEHLTWKTIQVEFFGSPNVIVGTSYVKLRICGNPAYDYSSLANLQAATTNDGLARAQTQQVRVNDSPVFRWYKLNAGADAASSPDKIRPTDWSAGDPQFWKLDKTTNPIQSNNWIQSILIDNVQFLYLPGGAPPLESITYTQITNPQILNTLTKSFDHGDIPISDPNYKYISKGHLQLLNGTPTVYWKRSYMANDSMSLVQLLGTMYIGQFQGPKYKLAGNWGYDLSVSFSNVFNELRTGKLFMPNAMTLNYADSSMICEMLELKQSFAGGAPPDIAEFGLDFGLDFAS